jgi:hypothetical protein
MSLTRDCRGEPLFIEGIGQVFDRLRKPDCFRQRTDVSAAQPIAAYYCSLSQAAMKAR